jgi:hypothetical protein
MIVSSKGGKRRPGKGISAPIRLYHAAGISGHRTPQGSGPVPTGIEKSRA